MRKIYNLPEYIIDIIDTVKEEKSFVTEVDAVKYIIDSYKRYEEIPDKTVEAFDEKYSKLLTRLRLATRTAEQNSIIAVDLINTMLYELNIYGEPRYVDSDPHEITSASIKHYRSKLEYYKQRKDNNVHERIEEGDEE